MNALETRVQLKLPVFPLDDLFGNITTEHTCECGHALIPIEDSEGPYLGFPPQVIEWACPVCDKEP